MDPCGSGCLSRDGWRDRNVSVVLERCGAFGYTFGMVSEIEWQAFFPAALLVAATPGANQMLTLRNGLRYGLGSAVSASAGRFIAFALMVLAVAGGLGAVLTASALAFNIIKWCGVAYLVWLGGRTIISALRAGGEAIQERRGASVTSCSGYGCPAMRPWMLARQEFMVAASNPKALILFTVFLPQFLVKSPDHVAVPLLLLRLVP